MSDTDKVKLISRMLADFWGCTDYDDVRSGAVVLLTAIATVTDFEEGSNHG